jgi:type I restriction enzyme S subunit
LSYLITGSGQPQITGDIKNHKVELPSIPEQQKIADFLTELDNRIDTVTRQLEAARQFKKSLFQQMFV